MFSEGGLLSEQIQTSTRYLQTPRGDADVTGDRRSLKREGRCRQPPYGLRQLQAIMSYLKDYHSAEYERGTNQAAVQAGNIQQFCGRTTVVTESKLEQLAISGGLTAEHPRIIVDVDVICEDCGQQFVVEKLLERNGGVCK